MHYLIDGYNLLHAMGALTGRVGPNGLEKARLRLLGLLRAAYGDEAGTVTVVFDASGAPANAPPAQDFHGVGVRFAREQEADDVIEEAVRRSSVPRQLTVVSDDRRVQQAARRRDCEVLGCGDYLDALERRRRPARRPRAQKPAKPEGVSREETAHWMNEFAGLDDDPDFKDLFNLPFDDPPPDDADLSGR